MPDPSMPTPAPAGSAWVEALPPPVSSAELIAQIERASLAAEGAQAPVPPGELILSVEAAALAKGTGADDNENQPTQE